VRVEEGTVLGGDFRIAEQLGAGGMGTVYRALQLSTRRARAVKVMAAELVRDAPSRARFKRECTVGARIDSDHLVQVIAAGVDEVLGVPFLAMELLEGESLTGRLERCGPLDVEGATRILSELCHALDAAHSAGVVHRDVKPDNVFLAELRRAGRSTSVKLLDLGVAKLVADRAASSTTSAIGTPMWMAPEQTGGKVGVHTDIWPLGLMAFWMLTGELFWRGAATGASIAELLREIAIEPIPRASVRAAEVGASLPGWFDDWFARCVVRERDQRFASAGEAHAAFAKRSAEPNPLKVRIDEHATANGATADVGELANTLAEPSIPDDETPGARAPRRHPKQRWRWLVAVAVLAAFGVWQLTDIGPSAPAATVPAPSTATPLPGSAPSLSAAPRRHQRSVRGVARPHRRLTQPRPDRRAGDHRGVRQLPVPHHPRRRARAERGRRALPERRAAGVEGRPDGASHARRESLRAHARGTRPAR
jgi:serine/threonine protein kinase